MTADRIHIFDTTLRDGEQSPGCSLRPAQKLVMARALAELGVDVIETGFPASSASDMEATRLIAAEIQRPGLCALSRCAPGDIEAAAKALERARQAKQIGGSLDAQVDLRAEGDWAPLLQDYQGQLRYLFIVSRAEVGRDAAQAQPSDLPGLAIAVRPADGQKCARCWNYSPRVGSFAAHPTVCERCAPVLEELSAGSNA